MADTSQSGASLLNSTFQDSIESKRARDAEMTTRPHARLPNSARLFLKDKVMEWDVPFDPLFDGAYMVFHTKEDICEELDRLLQRTPACVGQSRRVSLGQSIFPLTVEYALLFMNNHYVAPHRKEPLVQVLSQRTEDWTRSNLVTNVLRVHEMEIALMKAFDIIEESGCRTNWYRIFKVVVLHDLYSLTSSLAQVVRLFEHGPVLTCKKSGLQALMNLLQALVDDRCAYQELFERFLLKIVARREILPRYLFLTGVQRLGTSPVNGGGFADIWKGEWLVDSTNIISMEVASPDDNSDESDDEEDDKIESGRRPVPTRSKTITPSNVGTTDATWSFTWESAPSKSSGYKVALKVLRVFQSTADRAKLKEVCKEAMIWRQIQHKNVLPFYGVCEDVFPPQYALVSPWMENGNMVTYLKRTPQTPRVTMILGIASGLSYLHNREPPVVHGDLRGANVLIDQSYQPRITDFGLSRVVDSHPTVTGTSSSFHGEGALRWQAPELLLPKDHVRVTVKCDVYAFACVCLEAFTDKPPFSELRDLQVLTAVTQMGEHPKRPFGLAAQRGLDERMWLLMQECWRKVPANRPRMQDVETRISAYLAQSSPFRSQLNSSSGQATLSDTNKSAVDRGDLPGPMQTVSAAPSDMPLANPPDIFADPSIELQSQQSLQDGTLIGKKFSFGMELSNWAVLMIKDGHELEEFRGLEDPIFERRMATLTDVFVAKGIIVKTQPNYLLADLPRRKASDPRRKAAINVIRAMIKDLGKQLTFLMVFMSRPDERIYSGLKHLCDLYLDVHTICVNSDKILGESKSDLLQRFADVALRVNLKLGGIHDNLSHHSMTLLNQMPTMMVGITTSGPSNLNNAPSVAAVAASVDSFFAQYPASMRIQQWSGTAISGLREMIVERIENFLNVSKVLPERLIVFRSNVSNNLLPHVIEEEMREVIQAFKKYRQGTYRPDLTFIICYTREPNESTQRSIREISKAAPIAPAKTVAVEPFYFSSEVPSAIQDTPQRKHYYAVHHEISFTVDQLGQLMDDVDNQLVRRSEEEGIGSPAFYAFRACHRGRCYLRDLYEEIKTGSGKLDSTAVMQKSTELWFGGVRGETLKNSMFYL